MTIVHIDPSFDDDERRRRLYAGDLVMHCNVPAVHALAAYARERITEALAPHDPLTVQDTLDPVELARRLVAFKPDFIHDPHAKELLLGVVSELGGDLDQYYVDLPKLRSSYGPKLARGIAHAFAAHRDTWYGAPKPQINWWLPVWPVDERNALEFYPSRWGTDVPNSSDAYNYYLANEWRKEIVAFSLGEDTRLHPQPTPPLPDDEERLCVVPPLGGVLLFAADHLHGSIPNTSGRARYSIDFRTVHGGDSAGGLGAPFHDVRCAGTAIRDFRRGTTGEQLPPEVVALHENLDDLSGYTLEYVPDR